MNFKISFYKKETKDDIHLNDIIKLSPWLEKLTNKTLKFELTSN